jgi:D-alanyl-D-alanine carboxypeptidase/D-alanyl-D-alanine-endopeptidase (penicillin-binding protein 4)
MRFLFFVAVSLLLFSSCAPRFQQQLEKSLAATEAKFKEHAGFVLYDPAEQKTIYSFKGEQYFTPASNTKIFTFYTCLRLLSDSVPAFRYTPGRDSLIFWGTGDPSFLYKYVHTNPAVYEFLTRYPSSLYFSTGNYKTTHFGPGWAWDDYNDYYSTERSPFPMYGNIFWLESNGATTVIKPRVFEKYKSTGPRRSRPKIEREVHANDFVFYPGRKADTLDIPFRADATFIAELLKDTLHRDIVTITKPMPSTAKTMYSIPADSLYKVMMQESDNFIAEQLLLICAGILSDTLQPEIAIRYSKKNFLNDLTDEPVWFDGSGLSRYNLFTPRSLVQLWDKIYNLVPRERLFPLLATGGVNGTLKNWYGKDKPYIYAKTGTLMHNHCVSGYLVAKSGKVLIFSFMNSNYPTSTTQIRKNMQDIFNLIYEQY